MLPRTERDSRFSFSNAHVLFLPPAAELRALGTHVIFLQERLRVSKYLCARNTNLEKQKGFASSHDAAAVSVPSTRSRSIRIPGSSQISSRKQHADCPSVGLCAHPRVRVTSRPCVSVFTLPVISRIRFARQFSRANK